MARKHRHHRHHREQHTTGRTNWLRAAVLGSNDAIVSTAGLMIGVASADSTRAATLVAGAAGLVAGAMSMAVGEFVSVSSQRDAEQADIAKETAELHDDPEAELDELTKIYQARGLEPELARQVAVQLSKKDRLAAHLRDELGIEPHALASPMQAAWISAVSFSTFALVPIAAAMLAPSGAIARVATIGVASLVALGLLGSLGARLGEAPVGKAALRVLFGGLLAMVITAGIGKLFSVST